MKKQDMQPGVAMPAVQFPRYEFLILFLPVAVLVLVVGFSFATLRTDAQIEAVLDDDANRLEQISGFIGAQLSGSLNHLLAIAAEGATTTAVGSPNAGNLKRVEASLLTLARRNPYYHRIRWIDGEGQVRAGVARGADGPAVETARAVPAVADQAYFAASQGLLPGEVYISPVELVAEQEAEPGTARPMLRIATPAADARREARGVIVIEVAMHHVFDAIDDLHRRDQRANYLLLNRVGEVLNAANSRALADEGALHAAGFVAQNAAVWREITLSPSGNVEAEDGLWTWSKLAPAEILHSMRRAYPDLAGRVDQVISDQFELTLVAQRPLSFLLDLRRDVRMLVSLGTLLGLCVYGLSMYLYLSGHVRERRAELQAGYAVARAEHAENMKKLEERFHRLFEASSVGQLVVDGEGRIEIGNPAAARLLGYEAGELSGVSVDVLMPDSLRADHRSQREQYLNAPQARKMGEGRELEARTRDGRLVPVEIGLNPYQDDGRQLVLVSIVDLSQRRPAQTGRQKPESAPA